MLFSSMTEESEYSDVARIAVQADRVGLDAIWIPERHYDRFGGLYPSPAVLASYLAGITENIALRAGSVVAPLTEPIRIAEEWAMVDRLSGGRAGVALAAGWNPVDFATVPHKFDARRIITRQTINLLRDAWAGRLIDVTTGIGERGRIRIFPTPASRELPLWVTSSGSPESIKSAAESGCALLTHLVDQGEDELAASIRRYRASYRGERSPHVTVMVHTFVTDGEHETHTRAHEALRVYLRSALALDARSSGMSMDEDDIKDVLDYSVRRHLGQSLIGSREWCRQRIAALSAIGVDEIACVVDFGLDTGLVVDGIQRIADLKLS